MAIARDGHHAPLPNDIPAQPDPARSAQLEPDPACLLDGGGQTAGECVRLEDDEHGTGASGERREPSQSVPHRPGGPGGVPAIREVHHEQIHGSRGEQRRGQCEGLLEVGRSEHHEPLQSHAARDGLHGIEGPGEVQPRDDRATRLRLCCRPQRDRGLARRCVAAQRHRGGAREPTVAEDGVQRGEPGRDDVAVGVRSRHARPGAGHWRERGRLGLRQRGVIRRLERHRRPGQRAFDRKGHLSASPRSCSTPARLECRECLGDVG